MVRSPKTSQFNRLVRWSMEDRKGAKFHVEHDEKKMEAIPEHWQGF